MKRVIVYSVLLLLGLVGSQFLPPMFGGGEGAFREVVRLATMLLLSYIMIHVGLEFDIDKSNMRQYGKDYLVACTAAGFPWIFVAVYFVFVLMPSYAWSDTTTWKEALLTARFAAPTSAGVLFTMLAAAGLAATWLYGKARILAIFDDLDTVLFMIPLKMALVGLRPQLMLIVLLMAVMLWIAYRWLHTLRASTSWAWVMVYSAVIVAFCEGIYLGSKFYDPAVPLHFEVLLPGFVLGCILKPPAHDDDEAAIVAPREPDTPEQLATTTGEERAATIISGAFMVLVGLSMPSIMAQAGAAPGSMGGVTGGASGGTIINGAVEAASAAGNAAAAATPERTGHLTEAPALSWAQIAFHVVVITIISNIGKMLPALCYRREAHWRERLAVAVAMFPRGEVGAGVLVVSLSYNIGGPILTVALLSLALNLMLTGVFIVVVKRLIVPVYVDGKRVLGATPPPA